VVAATIPDHVRILDCIDLLDSGPDTHALEKHAGDAWLQGCESAVFRVPSAVVRGEWNYLINPMHLDFGQIKIAVPVEFSFDERLFIVS
jgi:RES domain-containing protein